MNFVKVSCFNRISEDLGRELIVELLDPFSFGHQALLNKQVCYKWEYPNHFIFYKYARTH